MKKEEAYTISRKILVPDHQILEDKPEYVYVPLRGYSVTLAVFDLMGQCIGWINVDKLGYPNVKTWMQETKWIDQGY